MDRSTWEGFKDELRRQNMSENTIRAYLSSLRQFFRIYPELTASNLRLYKIYLLDHYKPQTINLRIQALNSYLEYIGWKDGRIMRVKIQQKGFLDHAISEGDYEYLKSRLLKDKKYLYYFLIRFMAATGARVSEVVQFTVEDVRAGYKDVCSKEDKVRRVYIPDLLQRDALRWLEEIRRETGYIFLNPSGSRISTGGIRKQLKILAARYQLDEQVVYPHSFRHLFAKNFIEHCDDISLLSNLLGHESLETTRIYLKRSSMEQKNIINEVVDW